MWLTEEYEKTGQLPFDVLPISILQDINEGLFSKLEPSSRIARATPSPSRQLSATAANTALISTKVPKSSGSSAFQIPSHKATLSNRNHGIDASEKKPAFTGFSSYSNSSEKTKMTSHPPHSSQAIFKAVTPFEDSKFIQMHDKVGSKRTYDGQSPFKKNDPSANSNAAPNESADEDATPPFMSISERINRLNLTGTPDRSSHSASKFSSHSSSSLESKGSMDKLAFSDFSLLHHRGPLDKTVLTDGSKNFDGIFKSHLNESIASSASSVQTEPPIPSGVVSQIVRSFSSGNVGDSNRDSTSEMPSSMTKEASETAAAADSSLPTTPLPPVAKNPFSTKERQQVRKSMTKMEFVRTRFSFKGESNTDLPFKQGQILLVLDNGEDRDENKDWWYGQDIMSKKSGYFPSNYVKALQCAQTLYKFKAESPEEMNLEMNDRVWIVDQENRDWWYCFKVEFGSEHKRLRRSIDANSLPSSAADDLPKYNFLFGYVPSNHLEAFSSGPASTEASLNGSIILLTSEEKSASWASSIKSNDTLLHQMPEVERKRQEAMFEFIVTEQKYVKNLVLMLNIYYEPLAKFTDPLAVFSNLKEIYQFNSFFLDKLEKYQMKCRGSALETIAPIIHELVVDDQLKLIYSEYCKKQKDCLKHLQLKRSEEKQLNEFLRDCVTKNPMCRGLDLGGYLLEPMQRITRYPLLIKQILHYTPKSSKDYQMLVQSLREYEAALKYVNEVTKQTENRAKLQEIQDLLEFGADDDHVLFSFNLKINLLKDTKYLGKREFLFEGSLSKAKSNRKLKGFLFNDLLLLVQMQRGRYYIYRKPIALDEVLVKDSSLNSGISAVGSPNSSLKEENVDFEIYQTEKIMRLRAPSLAEKKKWLALLQEHSILSKKRENRRILAEATVPYLGTLRITIVEGKNLIPINANVVQLNNQKLQTKHIKDTLNPVWNQSLIFSVTSLDDKLHIKCFNYEKYSLNDYMGHVDIPLDFLEYYGEKSTEYITLEMEDKKGCIVIQMNYKTV